MSKTPPDRDFLARSVAVSAEDGVAGSAFRLATRHIAVAGASDQRTGKRRVDNRCRLLLLGLSDFAIASLLTLGHLETPCVRRALLRSRLLLAACESGNCARRGNFLEGFAGHSVHDVVQPTSALAHAVAAPRLALSSPGIVAQPPVSMN